MALLLAPSMRAADQVSANVVGYVQLAVPGGGQSLIANPLNNTDNHLSTILPLPATATNVKAVQWSGLTYVTNAYDSSLHQWYPNDPVLNPGEGFFIQNGDPSPLNLTFVGEVLEGNLTLTVHSGFSYVASKVPQARPLGTSGQAGTLQFPAMDGDTAMLFAGFTSESYYFDSGFGGWLDANYNPSDPVIGVAQGFGVFKGSDADWVRELHVSNPGGPRLAIALRPTDRYVTLTWTASPEWVLQSADDPEGPWTSMPSQASPYAFLPDGPKKFFRLVKNCVAITCPGDLVLDATNVAGAAAVFTVTATNTCTGEQIPVVCTPPSGSFFPLGTTTVDAYATLPGFTNHCTFTVTVECRVSANVVGYVQLAVPGGRQSLIANPLNGTNNNLNTILPLPATAQNVAVVRWSGLTYVTNAYDSSLHQWSPVDPVINPGEGFFVQNGDPSPLKLTFVGEVPEGDLTFTVPSGVSFVASKVPQAGPLGLSGKAGTLQFPTAEDDQVQLWGSTNWSTYTFLPAFGGWVDPDNKPTAEPVLGVAQGFAVNKPTAADWIRELRLSSPCGPRLAIALGPDRLVTLTWTASPDWMVQSTDDPENGNWCSCLRNQPSPFTVLPNAPMKFFRLVDTTITPLLCAELTSTNTLLVSWRIDNYQLQRRPASAPTWSDVATTGGEHQVSLDELVGWVTESCTDTNNVMHSTNAFVTTGYGWYTNSLGSPQLSWYPTNLFGPPKSCSWSFNPTNEATFFRLRKQ